MKKLLLVSLLVVSSSALADLPQEIVTDLTALGAATACGNPNTGSVSEKFGNYIGHRYSGAEVFEAMEFIKTAALMQAAGKSGLSCEGVNNYFDNFVVGKY